MQSNQTNLLRLKSIHDLQLNIIRDSIHDLKSPIGGIAGYIELMALSLSKNDGELNKIGRYRNQVAKGLEEIECRMNHLHEVVKEDFDIHGEDHLTEADISWVVEDICKNMKEICRQAELELKYEKTIESLHLSVDLILMKLMLTNLINNAVKYTSKPGRITVDISRKEKTANLIIRSEQTARDEKEIERFFLEELTKTQNNSEELSLKGCPFYFGAHSVGLMCKGAEMSVTSSNSFSVEIQFDLDS